MYYYYHKQSKECYEHAFMSKRKIIYNSNKLCMHNFEVILYVVADELIKYVRDNLIIFKNTKQISKKEYEEWIFINSI